MTRETKQIETPVGKSAVVLNLFVTGREYEYVQAPLFEAMAITPSVRGDTQLGNINVAKVQESTHRLLEKMVVSVDGKTEQVLELLLDMHQEDYQFVIDAVNELSKKN